MDGANRNNIGTVFGIEVIEVRNMLEVVGIDLSAVNHQIGLHIIFKFGDFEGPARSR